MTISRTLEKAKEFKKWNEWDTSTSAEFAESIAHDVTAELQKENARLREALEKIMGCVGTSTESWHIALAALSKEKE